MTLKTIPPQRRSGLDALRVLAVSSVFAAHSIGDFFIGMDPDVDGFIGPFASLFGTMGVQVFFVLSGFLIGGVLMRAAPETPAEAFGFMARRWLRTLPLYYAVLAALACAHFDQRPSWTYLVFLQGHSLSQHPAGFFPVSWSLAVEEWFYLALPLIALGILREGKRDPSSMKRMSLLLLGLGLSLRAFSLAQGGGLVEVRYTTWTNFDAIAMGVAMAAFFGEANGQKPSAETARRLLRFGTALILCGGFGFLLTTPLHVALPHLNSWFVFLMNGGFALLLPSAEGFASKSSGRLARAAGMATRTGADLSYAVYLLHLEAILAFKPLSIHASISFRLLLVALAAGSALAAAAAARRWIEIPVLEWRDRRFPVEKRQKE